MEEKKNYTRPGDDAHVDSPQDWLAGALVFAKALSTLLAEGEGIVIKAEGDAAGYFTTKPDSLLVVANIDNKIQVVPLLDVMSKEDAAEFEEGSWISVSAGTEETGEEKTPETSDE